jgi:integrase
LETVRALEEKRTPLILPSFSAHNLRNTFCTRLHENESNLKIIQSIMRHADILTTMDIYVEETAEKKQEVFAGLQNKIIIK